MIEFEFQVRRSENRHVHSDIELFYVMEGSVKFFLEDKQYVMHSGDFLVVNVDKKHSYAAEENLLTACLHISYSELVRMMKQNMVFFWCNTVLENNEACSELRAILRRIIAEQYRNQERNQIYLNSLYYELLHVLTSDFLLTKKDSHYVEETHKFDARKHEIEEYIRLNFDKQISLEDLASQLFLSYAYLSKYIKKQFGMGFADYLNSVRLDYAVSQLLHSDQSVVRIAMESGFASSAALNKAFKDRYGTTPTEYRRRWTSRDQKSLTTREDEESIRLRLSRHFENTPDNKPRERRQPEETAILTSSQRRLLKKNWCRMINIGTATDLLQSSLQHQLLLLKDELHFEYVRFWDIYNQGMYLSSSGNQEYNFDNLDRVLDFLLKHGMKPYIELAEKPKNILVNRDKLLIYQDASREQATPKELERFLRKLIIHLLNRYNTDQVETWYFEMWHAEPEEVLTRPNLAEEVMTPLQYLTRFQLVARVLREYLPTIRLGGGGFSLRYGERMFLNLLETWKGLEEKPDFLTLYCYPYTPDSIDWERNQTKNVNFLYDTLTRVREMMAQTEFPTHELHVSEWSFSVSNRNVMNDHCMKGAYVVNSMMGCLDLADIIGYWVGSDLYASYFDTQAALTGSCGLLSKDGIRKPAFYAFSFLNRLGKYVRKRDEHYIITDNGTGNYRIVCHNLKTLNHQYGLLKEDEIRIRETGNLFTDLKKYRIHFELPGQKGGKYLLRIHSVNQEHGSAQDEWVSMAAPEDMSREDLRYLDRMTVPRMVIRTCVAENGRIVFDLTMEPNEIDYIHVTYQYS